MKKGFKFLLCLILSIFIGIGAVNADDILETYTLEQREGNNWQVYNINPNWPFYRKLLNINGTDRYIFCLDSGQNFAFGQLIRRNGSIYPDQAIKEAQVANVYSRAYEIGLGEHGEVTLPSIKAIGSNGEFAGVATVDEHELYAITQMAIWNIVHGTDTDGYTEYYSSWIQGKNDYNLVFNDLMWHAVHGIARNKDESYDDYSLTTNGSNVMIESKDGKYLVSGVYTLKANDVYSGDVEFTIVAPSYPNTGIKKANEPDTSYRSSVTIHKNESVRFRVLKPSSGTGSVDPVISYKTTRETFPGGWGAYFYQKDPYDGPYQNIAIPYPALRNPGPKSLQLTGSYTNTVTLKVSKTDATGQKELEGAQLSLNDSSGRELISWESSTSERVIYGLNPGEIYEIVENYAPEGYAPLKNSIKFVLHSNGKVSTCKSVNNGVCEEMPEEDKLLIKNEITKLDISKRDVTTGEEIVGAELKICTIAAYEQDGKDCKPDKDEWSWVSGEEPHRIEGLTIGKYVLIETLPMEGYAVEMYINDEATSAYEFEITESGPLKIDVYNKLLKDVPKTGISVINLIAIGGLMVFIGYETINIYRKKVNTK